MVIEANCRVMEDGTHPTSPQQQPASPPSPSPPPTLLMLPPRPATTSSVALSPSMECSLVSLTEYPHGFLGSVLSKGLKTNQLELNTDEKTLRPIARLKEPRDLFALPKDKDHDCSQQAPRWPIECQVLEERVVHHIYPPAQPEVYNHPSGNELKPRPVGEENGVVVFNYNPISAVNYEKTKKSARTGIESTDSDISSSSRGSSPECSTPDRRKRQMKNSFTRLLEMHQRSSSNSEFEDDDDDDDEEDDDDDDDDDDEDVDDENNANANANDNVNGKSRNDDKITIRKLMEKDENNDDVKKNSSVHDIDDIWADKSPGYMAASPTYIKNQFGKEVPKAKIVIEKTPSSHNKSSSTNINWPVSKPNEQSRNLQKSVYTTLSENSDVNRLKGGLEDVVVELQELLGATQLSQLLLKQSNVSPRWKQNLSQSQESEDKTGPTSTTTVSSTLLPSPRPDENTHTNTEFDLIDHFLPQAQFSRSAVGGSRFLSNCHPCGGGTGNGNGNGIGTVTTGPADEYNGLEFESRFESGNLAKAVKITQTYYELYLRPDLYTSRSKQWFYFRVCKTRRNIIYRFSIVNLVKSDSLYNDGMRPLMYSTRMAEKSKTGWQRCGENICYYRNEDENGNEDDEENSSYTLTFNIEFAHDDDTVYFAHSYPYTYSDLQDYLMEIQKHPTKSKFCKLRLLCRSLAGNNVYYLTVTAPTADEEAMKRKKAIVVSARVHPSETPSSWMMKGLMDFITSESTVAKRLRHKFIFKLIPMLNPDGVIVGNTRNSLTGKDLNRQYRTVIRETYPSIWYTKAMIKRLIDECGVSMYCDMHAHSRKHNIFIYGCENKRNTEKKLTEQVFPLMMHKNVADKFSFESCKFKIQRSKEGTGRIVMWMLGITNSYTIEASFGGSSLGSRKGTHFNTADYEQMGRAFCETLLDYCDENPNKVKKQDKLLKQIKKIRKREKREKKALKLKRLAEQGCIIEEKLKERLRLKIIERLLKEGSSAEEPLNIPLSDYSSDEGDTTTSSSDNEVTRSSITIADLEGPCCAPTRAPPCSPELELRKQLKVRVRKIMRELDRIYFLPLQRKRFKLMLSKKRSSRKQRKKRKNSKVSKTRKHKGITATIPERLTGGMAEKKPSKKLVKKILSKSPQSNEEVNRVDLPLKKVKRRRKVLRILRLWLEKKSIFIIRRKKKHKKQRSKSYVHRKKEDLHRILLDLPTTDPGSELIFSTDDELFNTETNENACRVRTGIATSELQRRYIDEIGDGSSVHRRMPPELIVTSPTKRSPSKCNIPLTPKTAPNKNFLSEFPIIGGPTRRTNSWHNLHNEGRCISKFKLQNPFNNTNNIGDCSPTKEDLEVKLSLKKKIWSGIQPDTKNFIERNQPLSWNVPPLSAQYKKENVAVVRISNKDDNELLLSACSQKLCAWQQETNAPQGQSRRDKRNIQLNLALPVIDTEEQTIRIFKQFNGSKLTQKNVTKNDNTETKTKRRKNPLCSITEATQIFTRLNKTKSHTVLRQNIKSSSINHTIPGTRPQLKGANRFKAGGIVATAAVQPTTRKTRKLRGISNTTVPIISSAAKIPNRLSATAAYGPNIDFNIRAAVESSNFVRKVKTKLKKKKPTPDDAVINVPPHKCGASTESMGTGRRSGVKKTKKDD